MLEKTVKRSLLIDLILFGALCVLNCKCNITNNKKKQILEGKLRNNCLFNNLEHFCQF